MYLQEKGLGDLVPKTDAFDAIDHGVDVAEHLGSGDITWSVVEPTSNLSVKQDSSERLCIDEARSGHVQSSDGCLGICNLGGDVAVQPEPASEKAVRNVGFVLARASIRLRRTGEVAD